MSTPHHGLAATIRSATESETIDLAGQNAATITSTMTDAFSEPFDHLDGKMIRFTFIAGAGKLGRQKYDENAIRTITNTLRTLGFEEDRAASAIVECAGTYKLQHDTGKNLKTVLVFPKLPQQKQQQTNNGGEQQHTSNGSDNKNLPSLLLLPSTSPEHMIAFSSIDTFEKMITSKCPSWSQKRECVNVITSIQQTLQDIDNKLLSGAVLNDIEQNFYDNVSSSVLDSKLEKAKDLMSNHVNVTQNITFHEKQTLLRQVNERISTINEEITKLEAMLTDTKKKVNENQVKKKIENLKSNPLEKAKERKKKIESIEPKPLHPLKHQPEINKLRKELQPLLELEESAKGRLLSIKETQAIGRKDEILENIEQLEESSRGWFEDDDDFKKRIQASRDAAKTMFKKKPGNKKPNANSGFSQVGSTNKFLSAAMPRTGGSKSNAWGSKPAAAKKPANNNNKGGGVFAAMMMEDSDSD